MGLQCGTERAYSGERIAFPRHHQPTSHGHHFDDSSGPVRTQNHHDHLNVGESIRIRTARQAHGAGKGCQWDALRRNDDDLQSGFDRTGLSNSLEWRSAVHHLNPYSWHEADHVDLQRGCALPASTGTISQVVNKAPTTITLASSANPSTAGQTVTFTGKLKVPYGAPPAGVLIFKDGTTILGYSSLTSGIASFSTAKLASGPHSITATYASTANYLPSISGVVIQNVSTPSASVTPALKTGWRRRVHGIGLQKALWGHPLWTTVDNYSRKWMSIRRTVGQKHNSRTAGSARLVFRLLRNHTDRSARANVLTDTFSFFAIRRNPRPTAGAAVPSPHLPPPFDDPASCQP